MCRYALHVPPHTATPTLSHLQCNSVGNTRVSRKVELSVTVEVAKQN